MSILFIDWNTLQIFHLVIEETETLIVIFSKFSIACKAFDLFLRHA